MFIAPMALANPLQDATTQHSAEAQLDAPELDDQEQTDRESVRPNAPTDLSIIASAAVRDALIGQLSDSLALENWNDRIDAIGAEHPLWLPESPWVAVNKQLALTPIDYEPADLVNPNIPTNGTSTQLRSEAASALEAMNEAVVAETGTSLVLLSGYRSHEYQSTLYQQYLSRYGRDHADTISARPGHSEHQTGWAIDVGASDSSCVLQQCFAETSAGEWLKTDAWRFGYIVRYPQGGDAITGFSFEPWHLRYVGPELAAYMHDEGYQTLEEVLGLQSAPDYIG